jgi:hypothetical protein
MDSVACYAAEWHVNGDGSVLHVQLEAKMDNGWLGIGFSETGSLNNSDIITGYMKDNVPVVEDRFAMAGGLLVPVDDNQDVLLGFNASSGGGFTRITFSRSVLSNDTEDISLDKPVYVLLLRGSTLNDTSIEYTWMDVTSKPVNVTCCIFCKVQPCRNNGSCDEVNGVYGCVCPRYFIGPLCETLDCDPDTNCSGHGYCNRDFDPSNPTGVNNSVCLCEKGYDGATCENNIDECRVSGGNELCGLFPCLDRVGEYECDYCFKGRCQNGAACNPVNATASTEVTCNCTPTYSGTFCEIEQCIDPAVSCSGHGICNPHRNTSAPAEVPANSLCLCDGYTGFRCDTFIDYCLTHYKENCDAINETCHPLVSGFQCGRPCESNPCFNGGTCQINKALFTGTDIICVCPTGITGSQCETTISPVVTSAHGFSIKTPGSPVPTSLLAMKIPSTSSTFVFHSATPTLHLFIPSLSSAVVPSLPGATLLPTSILISTTLTSSVVQITPFSTSSTSSVAAVSVPGTTVQITASNFVSAVSSPAITPFNPVSIVSAPTSSVVGITPFRSVSTVLAPSSAAVQITPFSSVSTVLASSSAVVQILSSNSVSTVLAPISAVIQVTPSNSVSTVSTLTSAVVRITSSSLVSSVLASSSAVVEITPSSPVSTVSALTSGVVQFTSSSSVLAVSSPAVTLSSPVSAGLTSSAVVQITLSSSVSTVLASSSAVVQILSSNSVSTVLAPISAVIQVTPSNSVSTVSALTSTVVQITSSSLVSSVLASSSAIVQITSSSSRSVSTVPAPTSAVVQMTPSSSSSSVSASTVLFSQQGATATRVIKVSSSVISRHETTTTFILSPTVNIQALGSSDDNTTVIVGIVVGCIVLIAIIIIIILFIIKKSQSREGAYSPRQQENKERARVELGNVVLPPERERLI